MEGGEWSSFSAVCVNEEADFMAQLFPNLNNINVEIGFYNNVFHNKNNNGEGGSYYSSDSTSNSQNLYCFSQESSHRSSGQESTHNHYLSDSHHHHQASNASSLPFDFLQCQMDGDNSLDHGNLEESPMDPVTENHKTSDSSGHDKKRAPVSDMAKGNSRNVRAKKRQKVEDQEEENEGGVNGQSSSSSASLDDDCSSSKGTTTTTTTTTALNSSGKTRASRGSATDPQSLYARKRRERINERLRILQSLVPNGTKVDISTMLEEAVQYVKFLQLQIKLLSSDDMWMYAPIAYNGMNIGLDFKINIPR